MGRQGSLLFLALALGIPLPAQDPDPATYRPFLNRALLDKAPVIVRARFVADELLSPLDVQVTKFKVQRTLRGPPAETVLVGGMGERSKVFTDVDKLLFLKPLRSGVLHELVDLVDLVASEEVAAPGVVAAYVSLESEGNPLRALQALRDLSFRGLDSGSVFASRTAIRELEGLLGAASHLFSAGDLIRLEKLGPRIVREDQERFRGLLRALEGRLGAAFAGCESVIPPGEAREEFLRLVTRFRILREPQERVEALEPLAGRWGRRLRLFCEALLVDSADAVRSRAAFFLGEFGDEASLEAILRGLEKSQGPERVERIAALGKIGRPEAVSALKGELGRPESFDAACVALARIGGSESADLLERLEARLREVPGEDQPAARMAWLRSADFARDEARRRLQTRQRYGP